MKLFKKADETVHLIVQSVGKDPASWEGWHCIVIPRVENDELSDDFVENILCRILDLHLENFEGHVYTHSDGTVYVFSRGANYRMFVDACVDLADTYHNVFNQRVVPHTFDLFLEGVQFSRVCKNMHHIEAVNLELQKGAAGTRKLKASDLSKKRKKMKVLLVDDDRLTHSLIKHLLEGQCGDIDMVMSANDALESYLTYKPDIVFLDINLQGESGHDVLHNIKQHDENAYIVMFSGNDTIDNISNTLEAGANGFVAKPFRKEKLIHYINTCPSLMLH